jgi:mono/diheme cytochrome c family protein
VLIEAIREGGARFEGLNIGGSSNMPAFAETLSDEEILAVLAFIKSTWPEDVRALQRAQKMQEPSS